MTTCVDPVFGEMTYQHRWYKEQTEEFFGKQYTIKIIAKAYTGKPITDEQREAYKKYEDKKNAYVDILREQIIRYYNQFVVKNDREQIDNNIDLTTLVDPKSVLFKQDGTILYLLECVWDVENGIAVKVSPEVAIGEQYLFL